MFSLVRKRKVCPSHYPYCETKVATNSRQVSLRTKRAVERPPFWRGQYCWKRKVADRPDRCREHDLRETISDYLKMAAQAQIDAVNSKDRAVYERYLALVKALTELADTLQSYRVALLGNSLPPPLKRPPWGSARGVRSRRQDQIIARARKKIRGLAPANRELFDNTTRRERTPQYHWFLLSGLSSGDRPELPGSLWRADEVIQWRSTRRPPRDDAPSAIVPPVASTISRAIARPRP
jgi:hypothetical protein